MLVTVLFRLNVERPQPAHHRSQPEDDCSPPVVAATQLEQYLETGIRTDESGFRVRQAQRRPAPPRLLLADPRAARRQEGPTSDETARPQAIPTSLPLKEGVPPKVASERLGHSSVASTKQVYQHVRPGMQADAAATFGELVFGIPSRTRP